MVKSAQHFSTTRLAHEMFAYIHWTAKSNRMIQKLLNVPHSSLPTNLLHGFQHELHVRICKHAESSMFTYAMCSQWVSDDRALGQTVATYFFSWNVLIFSRTCCDVSYWTVHFHCLLMETIPSLSPITPCATTTNHSIVGFSYSITCTIYVCTKIT